jgi:hypothetical protein
MGKTTMQSWGVFETAPSYAAATFSVVLPIYHRGREQLSHEQHMGLWGVGSGPKSRSVFRRNAKGLVWKRYVAGLISRMGSALLISCFVVQTRLTEVISAEQGS